MLFKSMRKDLLHPSRDKMEDGTAEFVICLFTIVIIILCISFSFRIKLIDIAKENLEDGLTASALAAVIADKKEYLETGNRVIDTDAVYEKFLENLKFNLELDDEMLSESKLYDGSVRVSKFIVYNVYENEIKKITYADGERTVDTYGEEELCKLPEKGKDIDASCIYIELSTQIQGLLENDVHCVSVDTIVSLK